MDHLREFYLLGGLGPVVFGLMLLGAVRLSGQRASARKDVLQSALVITSWVAVIVGSLALIVMLFGVVVGAIALVVLAMAFNRRRRAEQDALVATLAVAASRLIPLVPAIEAFAMERRGVTASRAWRLARLLETGRSLPDALGEAGGLVSPEALVMIRVGQQAGALAPALRETAAFDAMDRAAWNQVMGRVTYLGFLLSFGIAVFWFMALKITPALAKIFDDFGAELPGLTQAVNAAGRMALNSGLVVLLAIVLVPLFVYLVLRYIGWIRWDLPGFGFLSRRLDSALILEALSLVARQAQPLPAAIEALAEQYPRRSVRKRLRRVAANVSAGTDWAESLSAGRLITADQQAVLQSAQRVGNLPWALREMADSSRRRAAYRAQVWVQFLFPLVILVYAAVVGLFVVSYLLPLARLIEVWL